MEVGSSPETTPPSTPRRKDLEAVLHHCGHWAEHPIGYLRAAAAEVRTARLGQDDCWSCRQAAKQPAADALGKNYPRLQGSEKQVAWAERIRAEWHKKLAEEREYRIKLGETSRVRKMEAAFQSETSAKWYIERRDQRGYNGFYTFLHSS